MKSLRVIVRRFGGPEVLETIEEDAPEPGRGELRVRIIAAASHSQNC
jgi:NADPH:quinone reductase-like Zn-dependent oxidoreductase